MNSWKYFWKYGKTLKQQLVLQNNQLVVFINYSEKYSWNVKRNFSLRDWRKFGAPG